MLVTGFEWMLSSVQGRTRDTGKQKTWFMPGDTNSPMGGDQLYLGETRRQQNRGCDDSMQIQTEGSGGVSSNNHVFCFYPHCSSPGAFIDVWGEVTGGQNVEGLDPGKLLRGGSSFSSHRSGSEDSISDRTNPKCEGGEAGGPQWTAEALKWPYRRLRLGISSISPSGSHTAGFSMFRTWLILSHHMYLPWPPEVACIPSPVDVISPCFIFFNHTLCFMELLYLLH